MAASAVYTGSGLQPSRDPHEAYTDAVILIPGDYTQGQAIGEFTARTAASEIQTYTFTGTPTGGTYVLSFNGVISTPITYSTTNGTHQTNVQAALDAMSNIGAGNSTAIVTSSGTVVAVTFGGTLANINLPLFVLYANGLTGGSAPTMTVAETTPGHPGGACYGPYDDTKSNGQQVCRAFLQFAGQVDVYGNHNFGGLGYNTGTARTAPAFFTGTFYTAKADLSANLPGLDANGVADVGKMIVGVSSSLLVAGSELRMF